jgi:hypothetical protein
MLYFPAVMFCVSDTYKRTGYKRFSRVGGVVLDR